MAGRPKGTPKTGGRKKGTTNKVTGTVREMILSALTKAGGETYLVKQAKDNPTAFLTLIGKVLPMQLEHDFKGISDAELIARAEGAVRGDGAQGAFPAAPPGHRSPAPH